MSFSAVQEASLRFAAKGWTAFPLNRGKGTTRGWKNAQPGEYGPEAYSPTDNIGVRLDKGLVDIDLDDPGGARLAPLLMPETAAFGRSKSELRHLIYQLTDPESCVGQIDLSHTFGVKLDLRACRADGSKVKQTMFPPSVHPDTNEPLVWIEHDEDPAKITWLELRAHFFLLGVATEILRIYDMLEGLGGRHQIVLDIAAAMRRSEWPQDLAESVLDAVMLVAGEADVVDRRKAIKSTYDAPLESITGLPTLSRHLETCVPEGSKLIELLRRDELPFVRSLPNQVGTVERKAMVAELLDMENMEDADLASVLFSLRGGDVARHDGKWYRREGLDWSLCVDQPRALVLEVSNLLKSRLDNVPPSGREEVLRKVAYCRGARGQTNVLLAGQNLFERDPMTVGAHEILTKSHVVDLATGAARPRGSEFCLRVPVPLEYNPDAKCPLWEKTLLECLGGNVDAREALQQSIGMSLCGADKEEKLIIWQGTGANGKSMVMRTLREVLGKGLVVQTPVEVLTGNQYRTTSMLQLRDSRIAYVSEFKNALNAGTVKQLTGGDDQSAYVLAKGQEEFASTWTVFLMTNELPHFNKFDQAMARRLFLIRWLGDFRNAPDLHLGTRLLDEAQGILNWCIAGYQKWRAAGVLRMDQAAAEILAEELKDMDPLATFAEDRLLFEQDARIDSAELVRAFREWARDDANLLEVRHWTAQRFHREFADKFGVARTARSTGGKRFFIGVRFRRDADCAPVVKVEGQEKPAEVVHVEDIALQEKAQRVLDWLGIQRKAKRVLDDDARDALSKLLRVHAVDPDPDAGSRFHLREMATHLFS